MSLFTELKRRGLGLRVVGAFLLLMAFLPLQAATPSPDAGPMTREQFDTLLKQVDNTGRWGEFDQMGTLNLITPEVRRNAAAEVRDGITVSLARELLSGPVPGAVEPMQIEFMTAPDSLLAPADDSVSWTLERIGLLFHGGAFTHVDALSHMSYLGRGYNGPAGFLPGGAPARNTIETMREGVVTRGVLMDLPTLRDEAYLGAETIITVADLEEWESRTGIRVRSGDVLLIRTGHWAREAASGPASPGAASPGIHPTVALWLHERGVAALGADLNDPIPSLVPGINAPLHVLALVAMGMPLFDAMDLEELSREATERSRWSFLFMAAPLTIRGGTGSPLNPLGVF